MTVRIITFVFLLSFISSVVTPSLATALPAPDASQTECTTEGGTWQSDNSGAWCSLRPNQRTPLNKAWAFSVTNAFRYCVTNSLAQAGLGGAGHLPDGNSAVFQGHKRISEEHLNAGIWFQNNDTWNATDGDPYKVAPSFTFDGIGDHGQVLCNATVAAAADLAGYGTNYKQFYCDVIPVKADGTSCMGGGNSEYSGDGRNNGQLSLYADDFYNLIKRKAFGAENPPLGNDALYVMYYDAFTNGMGCFAQPVAQAGTNADKTYTNIPVLNADKTGLDMKTFEGESRGANRWVYTNENANQQEQNCGYIADRVKEYANDYLAYIKKNPTVAPQTGQTVSSARPGQQGGQPGGNASACKIDGIGWIVCPVVRFMAQIVDAAYSFVASLLVVQPLMTTGDTADIYKAWTVMRNIANILFIIGFVVIIFSQVTGLGISNYGIKKTLPRLVVAAVLVNASYWICAVGVDLSNITGSAVRGVFNTVKDQMITSTSQIGTAQDGWSTGGGWYEAAGLLLAGTVATTTVLYVGLSALIPALLAALVAIIVVFLVLTLRQALIILLVVVSPLAFVALLLPNTEDLFKKWRQLFQTLLLMFPIIGALFGASALASQVVMKGANGQYEIVIKIMGALISVLPLALTPLVMKTAGGLLNRFAGMVNNPNKGPIDRLRKGATDFRDRRKSIMDTRRLGRSAAVLGGEGALLGAKGTRRRRTAAWLAGSGASTALNQQLKNDNAKKSLAEAKQDYVVGRSGDQDYLETIAGPTGNVSKIKAAAIAAQKNETADAIKNAKLSANIAPGDVTEMGRRFAEAMKNNNDIEARAMQDLMLTSGSPGISEYRKRMTEVEDANNKQGEAVMASNSMRTVRENMLNTHGALKAAANDLTVQAAKGMKMSAASGSHDTWQMSDLDLVKQKTSSINLAVTHIDIEQAKRIIGNEELASQLDPTARQKIKDRSEGRI